MAKKKKITKEQREDLLATYAKSTGSTVIKVGGDYAKEESYQRLNKALETCRGEIRDLRDREKVYKERIIDLQKKYYDIDREIRIEEKEFGEKEKIIKDKDKQIEKLFKQIEDLNKELEIRRENDSRFNNLDL